MKLVSHLSDTERCEPVLHKSRIARGRLDFAGTPDRLSSAAISRRMHRISSEPPSEAAESKAAGERLVDLYLACVCLARGRMEVDEAMVNTNTE